MNPPEYGWIDFGDLKRWRAGARVCCSVAWFRMILYVAAYQAARRALARDQRRPLPCKLPLWRLLVGEVVVLANRIGRWRVTVAAFVAFSSFLLVEVALSSKTPGPALAEPWRWLAAAGLTGVSVFVWATVHAIRSTSGTADEG